LREKGEVCQIVLVTDGCSNEGESPKAVAAYLLSQGVMVHVIGLLSEQTAYHGEQEARRIAAAGGGQCHLIRPEEMTRTIYQVTQKGAMDYLWHSQNNLYSGRRLHPYKRMRLACEMESAVEGSAWRIMLLIDASASMRRFLPNIKRMVAELGAHLGARQGSTSLAIGSFPGLNRVVDVIVPWKQLGVESTALQKTFLFSGKTPTGPALRVAYWYLKGIPIPEGWLVDHVI
jgi:Ca-activated chloride channel homolog